jgi:ligand-binding SRPBCC domain-containing protein
VGESAAVQIEPVGNGVFRLSAELRVPRPLAEVFPFYADAGNLEALTPPWLRFRIVTPGAIELSRGMRIEYRLRVHGVPVRWESEIVQWDPPHRFVDVQRRGPYRLWIHEHTFVEEDGVTIVRDRVDYAMALGSLVNRLFVARDLRRIFSYRHGELMALMSLRPSAAAAG